MGPACSLASCTSPCCLLPLLDQQQRSLLEFEAAMTTETTRSSQEPTISDAKMARLATMPKLLYGTAWKGDSTTQLVLQAFRAGFRGVDTAGQKKHYREDLVGKGVQLALKELGLRRQDVWLQTKCVRFELLTEGILLRQTQQIYPTRRSRYITIDPV